MNKNCDWCKSEFETKQSRKRFCSTDCQKQSSRKDYYDNKCSTNYFWIMERDNFTCNYCGHRQGETIRPMHLDHIKPKKEDGLDVADNLMVACIRCNVMKQGDPLKNINSNHYIETVRKRNSKYNIDNNTKVKL